MRPTRRQNVSVGRRRRAVLLGAAGLVAATGVTAMAAAAPGGVRAGNVPSARAPMRSASAGSRPEFAWQDGQQAKATRVSLLAQPSLCTATHRPGSYPWPVKPFDRQHPIRAYFGDPRTVFRDADDADAGAFSFHNGVDIVAADGTPVYPVISGMVTKVEPDEIVVSSAAGARTFQYWHLLPMVRPGAHVSAERTPLGTVQRGRGHVHLTEIDGTVVENPLQPGHLTPYQDHTAPSVEAFYFRSRRGHELNPDRLTGSVDISAAAIDTPPLPIPAPWSGVPVTPARVSWQLRSLSGRQLLPEQTPADFSFTIPPPRQFWSVYATGTYQNFPTVGQHYFYGTPGDYLFNLTPTPLQSRLLPAGRYLITVVAADTCGNRGALSAAIRILAQPAVPALTGTILHWTNAPTNGHRQRRPRRFWTVVLATLPATQTFARSKTLGVPTRATLPMRIGVLAIPTAGDRQSSRYVIFSGAFHGWAGAYTAAQRAAPSFPGAHPARIVQQPRRRPVRAGRRR